MNRRLAVAGAAIAMDLAWGELPNHYHPVAWLGTGIGAARRRLPREDDRRAWRAGLVLTSGFVGGAALLGLAAVRTFGRGPAGLAFFVEALLLKQAFAIRALFEHTETVERPLLAGDIDGAREAAARMVSRATDSLPEHLIASAAIESLAENSSDSIVAPLAWYALLGLPGAFAYRAANTLDATVGYHHFGRFGTPSARLDDVLNFVPARLTAALVAVASGRAGRVAAGVARDSSTTPSPNAGWPMSAAAFALDVRLEKEGRHVLNSSGQAPGAEDVAASRGLIRRALIAGGVAAVAIPAIAQWWRR